MHFHSLKKRICPQTFVSCKCELVFYPLLGCFEVESSNVIVTGQASLSSLDQDRTLQKVDYFKKRYSPKALNLHLTRGWSIDFESVFKYVMELSADANRRA